MADIKAGAQKLLEKLSAKIDDLTTLTVTTAVCSLEVKVAPAAAGAGAAPDGAWQLNPKDLAAADGMRTEINIVDGDIRNLVSPAFVTQEHKSLFDFHLAQVTKSQEIVSANMKALVELAQKLTS